MLVDSFCNRLYVCYLLESTGFCNVQFAYGLGMTPSLCGNEDSGNRYVGIDAPAKLNLGLEVIGRRDDGFHEIATVFLTIDLHDRVTLSPSGDLELSGDDDAPAGEDNLALRALRFLRDETNYAGGARLHLRKRIPTASGLGGASSDAAAALLAGRELWQLDVSDAGSTTSPPNSAATSPSFCAVAAPSGAVAATCSNRCHCPRMQVSGSWWSCPTCASRPSRQPLRPPQPG